jgi:hypothetical protein
MAARLLSLTQGRALMPARGHVLHIGAEFITLELSYLRGY